VSRDLSPAPDVPGRGPDRVYGPAAALLMVHGPQHSPSPMPGRSEQSEPPPAILRIKRPGTLPSGVLTGRRISANTDAQSITPPRSDSRYRRPAHASANRPATDTQNAARVRQQQQRTDVRSPTSYHSLHAVSGDLVFVDGGAGDGALANETSFPQPAAGRSANSAVEIRSLGTVAQKVSIPIFPFMAEVS
jgi:hypothetical protein